jgi:hypothetical protein
MQLRGKVHLLISAILRSSRVFFDTGGGVAIDFWTPLPAPTLGLRGLIAGLQRV